ncbi:DNA-binding protein [Actinomadura sp. WMMA1423]|uniref:nSTAND1 domain-containing NTPase n=1 Tax=Actinomadura sp. WMMA1423 TaxID=2591108 RepID=UPI00114779B6|nr:DNA-binding protein [Actinomadura sp. WMMA1423]
MNEGSEGGPPHVPARPTASAGLAPPSDGCPYQGLAPFSTDRSDLFFGRARATGGLLSRLGARLEKGGSILLVSGASGVGKSSLLRAGLIPALAEGALPVAGSHRWPRLVITPTAEPLRALAEAWAETCGGPVEAVHERLRNDPGQVPSAGGTGRLVLVVDQFEELFTLVADERERQAYVRALHALADGPARAGVVIGVRADYWDRCAAYPRFAEAIQDGQVIVEPMTESDLRLAVTGPAAAAGLELEPGLVETILADLRAGPTGGGRYEAGALPLLSQALRNTWDRREDGRLTIRGYEKSGGVRDSVRQTADEVLQGLPPEDRKTALRLFRRMTVITAGGRATRRRATLAEIRSAASARAGRERDRVEALLSAFAAKRLLTLHEDTAEIAHDALLTAWPTLRQWLEPDLTAQAVYDRLVEDAAEWDGHHRDPAFLYRGARLLAVDDVRPRWERDPDSFPPPGPTVERFVGASTATARRAVRRRRSVQAVLGALVVLALVAAVAAVEAADDAARQRGVAVSRQLAAQSETTGDTALSAMLAVAAWRIAPTDEARNRVLDAATRTGRGTLTGNARGVTAVAFSHDGSVIATGGDDGTARLWDAASRRQIGAPITRPEYECSGGVDVAFAPDGRTLATRCLDTVWFWDVATRRQRGAPVKNGEVVSALAYNPAGGTLATGDFKGVVQQWDATTHRPRGRPMGRAEKGPSLSSRINAVAFSRDGRTLAAASEDKSVRLWDVAASRQLGNPFTGHTAGVKDVALSPDGATLATVGWDRTARLWDMATRRQTGTLKDGVHGYNAIVFSPDGTRLATAGGDGRTVLWDSAGRQRLLALSDGAGGVERVAFSPDGGLLAAAGADGVVRLADPRTHLQIGTWMPARGAVALSPDGRTLATGAPGKGDPGIRLWDVATRRPSGPPLVPEGSRGSVSAIDFLPDGRTLLASGPDGLRLWDLPGRREVAHDGTLDGVAEASPDGRYAAVHQDGAIAFWDVARRRETGPRIRVPGHTDVVTAMAISPDGGTLAATGLDGRLRLFDVAARRALPGQPPAAAGGFVDDLEFSPDGRTLAYTAADSAVRLWDVARRRPAGVALIDGGAVSALAFSPDGRILATGSTDHGVRLWDLRVYRRLGAPMTGHTRGITAIAYRRDGRAVATVAGDGTARLWNAAAPADPVAAACANAGRSLTRDEWETLVPQEEYRRTCP